MSISLRKRASNLQSIHSNSVQLLNNCKILNCKSHIYDEIDEIVAKEYQDDSFHEAIRPIATFVQFLFLMPVCNISSSDTKNLKFNWKCFRVFFTLLYITYGIFITSLYFKFIYGNGINAMNIVGLVFFSYTTTCAIIFFCIAMQWPKLMVFWSMRESKFLKAPYKFHTCKLSFKIRSMAIVIILLAFAEHILFLANSANNQYKHVIMCNITVEKPLSYFLENQFGFIFYFFPFPLSYGIFNELMNMIFTFAWNYMELFVMMISIGLFTRFQQINQRLNNFRGKVIAESVWISIRQDYTSLCELVEKVDYHLRFLILLSNLNNLYFICFQLLNTFDSLPYIINNIYFWFSLIYLFVRTIIAQFMASQIHESSKYPIEIIKSIPVEGWCVEVQRFLDELRMQTIALSGMKFFYLTRKTILAMLATIVTYELVLMQLSHSSMKEIVPSNPCG